MAKFIVTLVRVEHAIYRINVEAEDQEQAEELAQEKWSEGEIDLDTGEVVHGEEFINQVEEIIPE
jgi:uncharacterized membrane protein